MTDAVDGEQHCAVCLDKTPSHTLQPCQHKLFCINCAPKLARCPLCRASIESIADTLTNEPLIVEQVKIDRSSLVRIGNKTNQAVIWHWMNGLPFKSLRMSTDGRDLFSYQLQIGHTEWDTDEKVVRDWTAGGIGFFSQTTSTHVNLSRRYADRVCCGN